MVSTCYLINIKFYKVNIQQATTGLSGGGGGGRQESSLSSQSRVATVYTTEPMIASMQWHSFCLMLLCWVMVLVGLPEIKLKMWQRLDASESCHTSNECEASSPSRQTVSRDTNYVFITPPAWEYRRERESERERERERERPRGFFFALGSIDPKRSKHI